MDAALGSNTLVLCPYCDTRCRRLRSKHGGIILIEVDEDGFFLHVHNAQACFEVLTERDRRLRAELRALSVAHDSIA